MCLVDAKSFQLEVCDGTQQVKTRVEPKYGSGSMEVEVWKYGSGSMEVWKYGSKFFDFAKILYLRLI